MAAGIPSLAFKHKNSGMGWVAHVKDLNWSQTPEALTEVLQRLSTDHHLLQDLGIKSRQRYQQLFARKIWLNQLNELRH